MDKYKRYFLIVRNETKLTTAKDRATGFGKLNMSQHLLGLGQWSGYAVQRVVSTATSRKAKVC